MSEIAERLLPWFDQHGRKNLPWQTNKTPYKVWISEIMLQQTQVATVIPYYLRFIKRFPDIKSLATAHEDEVLSHWSGLGYYARARNLHKCAQMICETYKGVFPKEFEKVIELPGIGRSTAGAILSLSLGQSHAILDGNVKRVLARVYCVDGWYGHTTVANRFWQLAEQSTPKKRVADYNQAMMDLGATVCVRGKNTNCTACPLTGICQAQKMNLTEKYPMSKPRKKLPVKSAVMLLACNEKRELLIQKRPPVGIWGGLWSLPEFESLAELEEWLANNHDYCKKSIDSWSVMRHTFSHYHLDIQPIQVKIRNSLNNIVMEDQSSVWYKLGAENDRGFPAPITKLIKKLGDS